MQEAMAGDAKSQYILATHYFKGNEQYAQNYSEAVKWLEKSARQGCSEAQDLLGFCYWSGRGVQKNYANAVYWYQKAAYQGNANAQRNLAICYGNGQGVSKDMTKALNWYKESAENGDADSQFDYAMHLLSGKYVAKDSVEACFYLFYSARGGHDWTTSQTKYNKKASDLLKKLADNEHSSIIAYAKYYYGKLCYFFDQYFDAEKYLYEAYYLGCLDAASELGYLYYSCDYDNGSIRASENESILLKIDIEDREASPEMRFRNRSHKYENDNAEYWFNEAISKKLDDSGMCYWRLCNIYSNKGDYKKAAISLERFLATGHSFNSPSEDSLRLADLYLLSDYNADKAFAIFKESFDAIENDLDSDLNDDIFYDWVVCGLGKCYYMGKGTSLSYENAVKYFKIAADKKDPEGTLFLSKCYRFGRGVEKNTAMADKLLKQAESLGEPTAWRIQALRSEMNKIK